MKCPKCGYLGFETTDRCRNCGYDFSLSQRSPAPKELALRDQAGPEEPLADFDLSRVGTPRTVETPVALDLRIEPQRSAEPTPFDLGELAAPPAAETTPAPAPAPTPDSTPAPVPAAPTVPPPALPAPARSRSRPSGDAASAGEEAGPLLTAPRPAGQPLSVRRATPEVPRSRRNTPRSPRVETPTLNLEAPGEAAAPIATADETVMRGTPELAGVVSRVVAALIDVLLLAAVDAIVLFLTLRITGLSMTAEDVAVLKPIPMGAFFAVLALGYLVGFTAGCGQTIGKMVLGLRVLGDDGTPVDLTGAVIRSLGALAAVLTLGLLYVPVLVTSDRRALHDRLAGTRVVRDRA